MQRSVSKPARGARQHCSTAVQPFPQVGLEKVIISEEARRRIEANQAKAKKLRRAADAKRSGNANAGVVPS